MFEWSQFERNIFESLATPGTGINKDVVQENGLTSARFSDQESHWWTGSKWLAYFASLPYQRLVHVSYFPAGARYLADGREGTENVLVTTNDEQSLQYLVDHHFRQTWGGFELLATVNLTTIAYLDAALEEVEIASDLASIQQLVTDNNSIYLSQ
ncbi:hypothetical protein [Maritalea porphyrae]|uniref:hypothetical protein n=1 Tax=Maritalea porphyrae TaxID=880732 RepID=UPI0022AFF95D|nr:hypothetical protein [Maritalea porphyrae]MCZ4272634.1 hypothetical protein [Maritalea porphyrae]